MERTVFFRTFEEDDIDAIYCWKNDDELNKMTVGLTRKICRDDVAKWVRSKMLHNPYEVYWAICANDETRKIIGYAQLTEIHFINSSANFSGIMIGNKNYHDGFAWIETYLFVMEYAFERLGLNSIHGSSIIGHKDSNAAGDLFLWHKDGVLRQAVFKNGQFYDLKISSLLRDEYFEHKRNGEYDIKSILKRVKQIKRKQ